LTGPYQRSGRGRRRAAAALVAAAVAAGIAAAVLIGPGAHGPGQTAGPAPSGAAADAPRPAAPTTTVNPPPCGSLHQVAGVTRRALISGGIRRTYRLELPPAYDRRRRLPLVLAFHGFQRSADDLAAYTRLELSGARRGVIVATPDGVQRQWNFVRRSAVGPDDVAFAADLVHRLERTACADPARVFAAGYSDGGDMADTLACALPDTFAAIAAVAPSVSPAPCAAGASVLEIHGTADPVVPYDGGGGDRPPPFQGTEAQPVSRRLAAWAALNGCSGPPSRRAPAPGILRSAWHCPHGSAIALLTVAGGGHTWPGAAPDPALGATSTAISANDVILDFFAAHPR
jgi:polyhydroxybutyrate depolymerase